MNHTFSVESAAKFGLEEAILIHQFQLWIFKNRCEKRNFREGKTWTYNSYAGLAAYFPYWTERKVRRYVANLVKNGVLIVSQFKVKEGDCRNWYAFKNEGLYLPTPMPETAEGGDDAEAVRAQVSPDTPMPKTADGVPKRADVYKDQVGTASKNGAYVRAEADLSLEEQATDLFTAEKDKSIFNWLGRLPKDEEAREFIAQVVAQIRNGREMNPTTLAAAVGRCMEEWTKGGRVRRRTMQWIYNVFAEAGCPTNGNGKPKETLEEESARKVAAVVARYNAREREKEKKP